jgi:DNA-binding winged helix-turn-helix (wHTH) protein/Flp pilus assembly protein TadD
MAPNRGDGVVRFGRFTVDLRTEELQEGDRRLAIQGKPLQLLIALLEHPGQLVTREKLYTRLWRGSSGDYQRGLDTAVRKLRKVLGDPADNPVYIETLPRRGYRLLAPVSVVLPSQGPDRGAGSNTIFSGSVPGRVDSEAGRLYLEGYHCWNRRTPAAQSQALAYFLRARELDPTNSDYHAAIAHTHFMRAWHGVERPVDAIAEAKSAAVVALLNDHAQSLAHVVLAAARGVFDYDLKGALTDLRAAIQVAPDHPFRYVHLSIISLAVGAKEEADEALRKAHELDPVSPTILSVRGLALYLGGRFEEAEKAGRKAVVRDPEFGLAHFYYGMELMAVRHFDEAVHHLTRADQLMVDALEVRAALGVAIALGGDRARAARIDEELEEAARSRYVDGYHRALLKDALGMRAAAVALLERACEDHSHWFSLAAIDPKLEALRSDPRVQALMRRLRR